MSKTNGNLGFTLMELMIAVAIIAIGAAVCGFSIRNMMPDIRLSAAARDLKSDLNLARLRALRENKYVSLVFDLAEERYRVFVDANGNGELEDGNGDIFIKEVKMPQGINLASFRKDKARTRFNSRGLVPGSYNGEVVIENSKEKQRKVTIAPTGRVRIE